MARGGIGIHIGLVPLTPRLLLGGERAARPVRCFGWLRDRAAQAALIEVFEMSREAAFPLWVAAQRKHRP